MALRWYRQQDWKESTEIFQQLAANEPDTKLYRLYLSRIQEFQNDPPPAGWDGVTVFTQK